MARALLKRWRDREDGNVAITFAMALVPITLMAGSAIDYSRASQLRGRLQAAADSAVLQLCRASRSTSAADLQKTAQAFLNNLFPGKEATADTPVINDFPRQITLTARATYNTTLSKVGGVATIPLAVESGCEAPERFFEIAMSLDTTGSMATSDGTKKKIDALKDAATKFVNSMFSMPSLAEKTKIALVPFSAGVAVDPATFRTATWIDQNAASPLHWQNVTGAAGSGFKNRLDIFTKLRGSNLSWDWAGCFESLPYPLNVQDGAPTPSKPESYYVPMFAPDEAGDGGQDTHKEISSGKSQTVANSYVDDDTLTAGCTTTPNDDRTRTSRACKYVSPRGADTSNSRGPNFMCRSRPLTRLTNAKDTLTSEIGKLQPAGNTNIHEGVMWGWRTLSPNSVFADGVAYSKPDTTKVLVLMTDGMNTWGDNNANPVFGSLYSAYGYFTNVDGSKPNARLAPGNANPDTDTKARAAMDALTRQACSAAEAAGIVIYTVGFSITQDPIDAQGLQLLKDCAGKNGKAYVANNADALVNVFTEIAQGIGKLRIRQ